MAKKDIDYSRSLTDTLVKNDLIENVPQKMLQDALDWAVKNIRGGN